MVSGGCALLFPGTRNATRLGKGPLNQPDVLYINSSKMPEAARTLDAGLSTERIRAWAETNGFTQVMVCRHQIGRGIERQMRRI